MMNDGDRLIASGSVLVAAGALAVLFSRLSGTGAFVLVWKFGAVAIAAFAPFGWSWYRRAASLLPSGKRTIER